VLVATNAAGDKRELRAVQAGAARDITGRELPGIAPAGRFTLEDGEVLARRHFGSVARIDQTSEIVLADAEPAVRHATSTWNWHGDASLPAAAIEDRMRELIRAAIDRHGAFRIGTHSGVLVCR
jgi:hypothetical protein